MKHSIRKMHHLFHGELTDAPGRNEEWDDYLRYLGHSRWEIITEGSDFSGASEIDSVKQTMGTRSLIEWVRDRDADFGESLRSDDPDEGDCESNDGLGPLGRRLLEIANSEGAHYCVTCLEQFARGDLPPYLRPPKIRILNVKGVTRRNIWIRISHVVFDVDTNLGPAFLYPPSSDRDARLVLKSERSMSQGRLVKISRTVAARVRALMPDLEALTSTP